MASTSATGRQPEQVSEVVDRLEAVSHITGYRLPEVFIEWVDLTVAAFERDDNEFLSVLDKIVPDRCTEDQRREVAEQFTKAFGDLVIGTCELQRPIIGDVYEVIGANSSRLGQYFTP